MVKSWWAQTAVTEQSSSDNKEEEMKEDEDENQKIKAADRKVPLLVGSNNNALFVCAECRDVLINSFKLNRGYNRL